MDSLATYSGTLYVHYQQSLDGADTPEDRRPVSRYRIHTVADAEKYRTPIVVNPERAQRVKADAEGFAASVADLAKLLPQVESWLGGGENAPVSSQEILPFLAEDALAEFSTERHLGQGEAVETLGEELAAFIDAVSPAGEIDAGLVFDQWIESRTADDEPPLGALLLALARDPLTGPKFTSWTGEGDNEPLTAGEVTAHLDPKALAALAAKAEVSPEQAAENLATEIPAFVAAFSAEDVQEFNVACETVDGLLLTEVGESALAEVEKLIDRISLLVTEALNGTYSPDNLNAIQQEIQQGLDAIDAIGQQTQFNGNYVLGEDRSYSFQIGTKDGKAVLITTRRMNTSTLGLTGLDVTKTIATTVDPDTPLVPADLPRPDPADGTLVSYIDREDGTQHYALLKDGHHTAYPTGGPVDLLNNGKGYLNPLATLTAGLGLLNNLRGRLGSSQNRFQSNINTLSITVTNLTAARSRIQDTDYAAATASYIQTNILLKAGHNVLAKVNQQPQMILILVRDL
ncbi:flagellin [Streptomyces pinistramenti]|uniref:flagellin n=1 Tax=Streptomyces pinistramenti TaxID=2884812 RepID=UPI001D090F56|nr:flagellin [Streptomyces pinistramenti]MCB5908121.1 YidB family protein [Streptomyces pinistramenti]